MAKKKRKAAKKTSKKAAKKIEKPRRVNIGGFDLINCRRGISRRPRG